MAVVSQEDGSKTPSAGWKVHGCDYLMEQWERAASIYLAMSPDGTQSSVQFWYGDEEPTPYHGYWKKGPDSSLYLVFNGRGPGVDVFDGVQWQRELHGTLVQPCDDNPRIFKGTDYRKRKITIHYDRTWTVTDANLFVELDVCGDSASNQLKNHRADPPDATPSITPPDGGPLAPKEVEAEDTFVLLTPR